MWRRRQVQENKIEVSDVIKRWMERQDLPVRDFAQQLGVSHPTVLNWQAGKGQPSIDFLVHLAQGSGDWRHEFALDCLDARLGLNATRALNLRKVLARAEED